MQVKTIHKAIIQKLEWWLKSITDKELRNDVRDNILLTGGSICNLLQQQPVNDYDLYLMDMDVLVRLCRYYTSGVKDIEIMDGREREAYMNGLGGRPVWEDMDNSEDDEFKEQSADWAMRSVAIRMLQPNQVKLFMHDPSGYNPQKGKAKKKGEKPKRYSVSFISSNAISLHGDIQIVTRFTGSPETIHKTFDFIHATNYFTFKEGLVFNLEAVLSIQTRQLYYQGSRYPLSSIIRVKKFVNRGWHVSAGEQLKMIYQCSKLNLDDPDILEDQLIGIDVAYFGALLDILRGKDKDSYTMDTLNEAINVVFNSYEYDMDHDEEEPDDE